MTLSFILAASCAAIFYRALGNSRRLRLYLFVSSRVAGLGWLAVMLISVAISALSYVIAPKPKPPKPPAAKEMDSPVAVAGKPVSVVMGTKICSELNILWTGDKSMKTYDTNAT